MSFWRNDFSADLFGATYFVAGLFHRSFRRQFGALWQFSYLGFGLGLGLVKKHRIGAEMVAPKSRGPS